MNKLILILLTQSAFGFSSKPPVVQPTPAPTIAPSPSASPIPVYDPMQSACAKYGWGNRGRAPSGYLKGMVEMYKIHACDKVPELRRNGLDALVWYGKEASMLNTYTLLLGLGMRESSGIYCTGRDTSAGKETSEEAETGLFQFSRNSIVVAKDKADLQTSLDLQKLVELYKSHPEKCMLDTFKEGISQKTINNCNSSEIVGSGPGADFQKLGRSCPAFAVEYASLLIRRLRNHFGPLNRKEAEFNESCRQMFLNVKGECK
jgi:hypothetical protein